MVPCTEGHGSVEVEGEGEAGGTGEGAASSVMVGDKVGKVLAVGEGGRGAPLLLEDGAGAVVEALCTAGEVEA